MCPTHTFLFTAIRDKNFKKMRTWVINNIDVEPASVFRGLYDRMYDHVTPNSIPQLVLILADYQYKNAFMDDHELNLVVDLTEVMASNRGQGVNPFDFLNTINKTKVN